MADMYRKRKKVCQLCAGKTLDYKSDIIKKYIGENGRKLPRRMTGTCFFIKAKKSLRFSKQISLSSVAST